MTLTKRDHVNRSDTKHSRLHPELLPVLLPDLPHLLLATVL